MELGWEKFAIECVLTWPMDVEIEESVDVAAQ
jgi:hypothetical protein